jgi:magnesium transporter
MRPTLHIPVPSSALLEFLKVQSESICFFSTNPRPGFTFDHAAPRGPLSRSHIVKTVTKPITRGLSTAVPGNATIEAGFLNFDFLWPRSITPRLLPRSSRNVSRGKDQAHSNTPASQCRSASSRSSKWHEKLWGVTSKKGGRPLRPDDLPGPLHSIMEDGSDSMFKKGRSISAKAAAQPKLRCTELDENGNVVLASGEFKKSELIAKVPTPYAIWRITILILPLQ